MGRIDQLNIRYNRLLGRYDMIKYRLLQICVGEINR